MFAADFDYWFNQEIDEVLERDSFEIIVERVQDFQNEDIEVRYRQTAEDSLSFDPEAQFSTADSPTLRLYYKPDSRLRELVTDDVEALEDNENGAVLHSYNIGRGVENGVRDAVEGIEQLPSDYEPVLEVLDETPADPAVYEADLAENAVYHLAKSLESMDKPASNPMALGVLAAYREDS